jgi:hypothetical protein
MCFIPILSAILSIDVGLAATITPDITLPPVRPCVDGRDKWRMCLGTFTFKRVLTAPELWRRSIVLFVLTVLVGNSALSGHQKVSEIYIALFLNVSLVIAY